MTNERVEKRLPGKTRAARHLRKLETAEENLLWSELRNRQLNGHKFTRQVPLGNYVVDFLCRDRKLVVEADGFQHADAPTDTVRTRWLNENGYAVLRFWNHEITRARQEVLDTILCALTGELNSTCKTTRFFPAFSDEAENNRERQL
ncbi:MAG: DUF559 domain-containing protein [Proteobacteria bacterium]|nr:DUF559 domain-containing protein [Pseudomonadota bacterium]